MKGSNILAFLGGALVGGVIALLYAPKSGKETRGQIKDFVEDEVDQVKDFVGRNYEKAKRSVSRGVSQARDMVNHEIEDMQAAVCDADLKIKPRKK